MSPILQILPAKGPNPAPISIWYPYSNAVLTAKSSVPDGIITELREGSLNSSLTKNSSPKFETNILTYGTMGHSSH